MTIPNDMIPKEIPEVINVIVDGETETISEVVSDMLEEVVTEEEIAMDFILSTEDVNAFDMIVATEGMDISMFNSDNSPALMNHNSDKVIGKWVNTRKEGTNVISTLDFDNDSYSQDMKNKVIKGSLKKVSIGIDFKRDDLEILDNYVVRINKCVLREASLTPLPANPNAKKLSNGVTFYNEGIKLNTESLEEMIKLKKEAMELQLNKQIEDLTVTNTLVLSENDTLKVQLSQKEIDYNELKLSFETLKLNVEGLTNEVEGYKTKEKEDFISNAILEGKITDTNKEEFVKLSNENFELCKSIVNKLQRKAIKLSDEIVVLSEANSAVLPKYETLSKAELSKMAKENPVMYKEVEIEYVTRTTK